MGENGSLISIDSDKVKTSDRYDYMCDQEVQKILKVDILR